MPVARAPFFGYKRHLASPFRYVASTSGDVENGCFAEHWDELNTLEVFQQIGAVEMLAPE